MMILLLSQGGSLESMKNSYATLCCNCHAPLLTHETIGVTQPWVWSHQPVIQGLLLYIVGHRLKPIEAGELVYRVWPWQVSNCSMGLLCCGYIRWKRVMVWFTHLFSIVQYQLSWVAGPWKQRAQVSGTTAVTTTSSSRLETHWLLQNVLLCFGKD